MNNDRNVLRCNCNYSLMLMIFMKHSTRSTVDLFNVVRKIAKITTCTIDRWESRSVRSIFFYGYIDLGLRPQLICFPRTNAKDIEKHMLFITKMKISLSLIIFIQKSVLKDIKKQVYRYITLFDLILLVFFHTLA